MKQLVAVALAALAGALCAQPLPREEPGLQPDGSFLLASGWRVRPAGKQIPVDTFPMSLAPAPGGRYLLVLNAGYLPPSISVVDATAAREVSRVPAPDAWLGLTFSPDGKRVYAGGGGRAAVFEFLWDDGALRPGRTFAAGGEKLAAGGGFIGDVAFPPGGRLLYAADFDQDAILVINPQSGRVIERYKTLRRPYRILFHPDGKSFYVSGWGSGAVAHHQTSNGEILSTWRVGPHPAGMVWSSRTPPAAGDRYAGRLYVAVANTNAVRVAGVSSSGQMSPLESIHVALEPRQPLGMTPSALALSPAEDRLFVVCSDANAVAVVDVAGEQSRVLGFLPAGWYPTAVGALAGGMLAVANGRGGRSYPNPRGPNPVQEVRPAQYVGRMQTGSVSLIAPFDAARLEAYSQTVMSCSRYRDAALFDAGAPPGNPVRTYDQVFGDLRPGKGDPSLVVFGEQAAPNHRKLAREFVLLDNFYATGDVCADGRNWSTAAIAPDFVQKLWPASYGGRRRMGSFEGGEPANFPPAGYLWNNAIAAGLSVRNYGLFVHNRPRGELSGIQVSGVRDPALGPVTNLEFRGLDPGYPDVERARVLLRDLAAFEASAKMPQLIIMHLGNDSASSSGPGGFSPLAAFADNDSALGMIVEAVSRSRFWPQTAIFVLEDDAQDGADHVDAHRSPAFVISPYVKRRSVVSTMYNTLSMLRTMELILGLRPMTHFDAAARPMYDCFQGQPDTKPFVAEKPRIRLEQRHR